MARRLKDGTVLPSFLGAVDSSSMPTGARHALTDGFLRVGEVVEARSPKNPLNINGSAWEYVVNVPSYRGEQGLAEAPQRYVATLGDKFGNLADRCRFSLRAASSAPPPGKSVGDGAVVLLLCPSGDQSQAVIIGAWRQPMENEPSRKVEYTDPSERFFEFEFNGVGANIDKDGALTLKVPGATKLDGTPADDRDKNNHGTQVSFGKDGSVTISDGNGDTVTVSPKDKSISVTAGDHTTTVEKKWKLKAATVEVEANEVSVNAGKVNLGGDSTSINPLDEVVVGSGIDTFTGLPYKALGNTSSRVKARK